MTSKALMKLANEHNVDMPIVNAVYNALFENKDVMEEINKLFLRDIKQEF
jgi:glycerol-3-phosphate dehydrogenase (NAD(P)+)